MHNWLKRWMLLAIILALTVSQAWATGVSNTCACGIPHRHSPSKNLFARHIAENYQQWNVWVYLHIAIALVCVFAPLATTCWINRHVAFTKDLDDTKKIYCALSFVIGLSLIFGLELFAAILGPISYLVCEMCILLAGIGLGSRFDAR